MGQHHTQKVIHNRTNSSIMYVRESINGWNNQQLTFIFCPTNQNQRKSPKFIHISYNKKSSSNKQGVESLDEICRWRK